MAEGEIEIALVIAADDPQAIASQIETLTDLARFRLVPRGTVMIHDIHLDTSAGWLDARRWALRLREIDGSVWLTLKGPSSHRPDGGTTRREIERMWSEEALAEALQTLRAAGVGAPASVPGRAGVGVPGSVPGPAAGSPLDVMRRLGLVVVQDRHTHRALRDVVETPGDRAVAELAIDVVTYHLPGRDVYHFEVEIEAKTQEGRPALGAIAADLARRFAPALRPRMGSKLTLGTAIARLHAEGALESLLGAGTILTPAAYEIVAARGASN
jgi:inorganic triphosphatase YgiF